MAVTCRKRAITDTCDGVRNRYACEIIVLCVRGEFVVKAQWSDQCTREQTVAPAMHGLVRNGLL